MEKNVPGVWIENRTAIITDEQLQEFIGEINNIVRAAEEAVDITIVSVNIDDG